MSRNQILVIGLIAIAAYLLLTARKSGAAVATAGSAAAATGGAHPSNIIAGSAFPELSLVSTGLSNFLAALKLAGPGQGTQSAEQSIASGLSLEGTSAPIQTGGTYGPEPLGSDVLNAAPISVSSLDFPSTDLTDTLSSLETGPSAPIDAVGVLSFNASSTDPGLDPSSLGGF